MFCAPKSLPPTLAAGRVCNVVTHHVYLHIHKAPSTLRRLHRLPYLSLLPVYMRMSQRSPQVLTSLHRRC